MGKGGDCGAGTLVRFGISSRWFTLAVLVVGRAFGWVKDFADWGWVRRLQGKPLDLAALEIGARGSWLAGREGLGRDGIFGESPWGTRQTPAFAFRFDQGKEADRGPWQDSPLSCTAIRDDTDHGVHVPAREDRRISRGVMPQKSNNARRRGPVTNAVPPASDRYQKYLPEWMKDGAPAVPRPPRPRRARPPRPAGGYTPGKFAAGDSR